MEIFKQKRVGENGKVFTIYKIKTLDNGVPTKEGLFLRKWRIDELPQILNIIKRDMNLVGPRPLTVEGHINSRGYDLPCKPGITGLWQIKGCRKEDLTKWDSEYYKRRSLWYDLKIMVLTIPALIKGLETNHAKPVDSKTCVTKYY